MSNKKKPRHAVLDKESIAIRKIPTLAKSRLSSPAAPAKALRPTTQVVISTFKDAVVLKSTSSPIASLQSPIGPFALSSGREVRFSQVAGRWEAVVKESWGTFSRKVSLPVARKEDLSVALHNLEGKEVVHTKRRIQILETAQPPSVYMGYLGLRGGMEKEEDSQALPPNETSTAWHPPFVARPASLRVVHPLVPKKQEEAKERAPKVGGAPKIDRSSEALATVASASPCAHLNALSGQVHEGSSSSAPTSTAARSRMAPSLRIAQARPPLALNKPPTPGVTKLQQIKTGEALHARYRDQQAWVTLPPTSLGLSDCKTQPSLPPQSAAHPAQTEEKPNTNDTVPQPPSCVPYSSAQGHQVRFQEADGKWLAQVQDGWGREQELPVICAPDQTPTQALQKLASKAPGQHKYWVHVLETHQPPWAPRVVYVGAIGVRGGMQGDYVEQLAGSQYFELAIAQLSEDSEQVKMSVAHMVLNMMIPEHYASFCQEVHEVFMLLQSSTNADGLMRHLRMRHLRSLFEYIRNVSVITNAIPLYVSTFGSERAEVVGIVIARFLLPTGRLSNNPVRLCRESCQTLLEGIRRIVAEQSIRGNAGREAEEECDALHTEASREAHRQLTEQERIRKQESRDRRLAEEQYQREQERIIQAQEASEQEASLRVERERLLNAAERRRRRILSNSANRLARIRGTQSFGSEQQVSVVHAANSIAQVPEVSVQVEEEVEARNKPRNVHKLEASQEVIEFIGRFESFRAHMYKVSGVGRWTIGYGHEFDDEEIPRYEAGITKVQAQELLHQDVQEAIEEVRDCVSVQLTQYQFDALVSYVYNTGSIRGTRLLINLTTGNLEGAAREMDIVTQTNPSTGERVVLPGLVIRREQERQLFLNGDYGN